MNPPAPPTTAKLVRTPRFQQVLDKALDSSTKNLTLEHFSSCFPTIAKSNPAVLKNLHTALISRFKLDARENFSEILAERNILSYLNDLDVLLYEADARRREALSNTTTTTTTTAAPTTSAPVVQAQTQPEAQDNNTPSLPPTQNSTTQPPSNHHDDTNNSTSNSSISTSAINNNNNTSTIGPTTTSTTPTATTNTSTSTTTTTPLPTPITSLTPHDILAAHLLPILQSTQNTLTSHLTTQHSLIDALLLQKSHQQKEIDELSSIVLRNTSVVGDVVENMQEVFSVEEVQGLDMEIDGVDGVVGGGSGGAGGKKR